MSGAAIIDEVGVKAVSINEVGPRDGLQNQDKTLSPAQRRRFVEALLAAGIRHIEIGSFVSPRAVPQMAGTDALARALGAPAGVELSALAPNIRGYERARDAGVETVAVVVAATETMNRKNIGRGLAETLAAAREVIARGRAEGVGVQAYLAVAFECPFEGPVAPPVLEGLACELLDAGADRLVIADTIGAADPAQVKDLMSRLLSRGDRSRLACHFHDTRALGLANVYAALECGVRRFDASAGGLGGCPFAPGARGNVATEDVAMLCERLGYATGIAMPALLAAVRLIGDLLGRPQGGRAHDWLCSEAAQVL